MSDEVSDFDMATKILEAIDKGWDPTTRDLQEGLTIAELRDIDQHERYWTLGQVTDEDAHAVLIRAYHAAVEYLSPPI